MTVFLHCLSHIPPLAGAITLIVLNFIKFFYTYGPYDSTGLQFVAKAPQIVHAGFDRRDIVRCDTTPSFQPRPTLRVSVRFYEYINNTLSLVPGLLVCDQRIGCILGNKAHDWLLDILCAGTGSIGWAFECSGNDSANCYKYEGLSHYWSGIGKVPVGDISISSR